MLTENRKNSSGRRKWMTRLLCTWMMVLGGFSQTWAAETDAALTIICKSGEMSIAGAEFTLYQVAEISEPGNFMLTGDFTDCLVDLKSAEWENAAKTLHTYAVQHVVAAIDSGKTDETGTLHFPCKQENMASGMYLVVGKQHAQNGKIYTVSPFLSEVPEWVEERGEWCYDVTVYPKFACKAQSSGNGGHDSGSESGNPGSSASSFENPILVEELTIVEETTPPFVGLLPKTGQLWWPVPLLAGAGILCILAGLVFKKKIEKSC